VVCSDRVSKRPKLSKASNVSKSSPSNGTPPRSRSALVSEDTVPDSGSEQPPSRDQRMMPLRPFQANLNGRALDVSPGLRVSPGEVPSTRTSEWVKVRRTTSGHQQNLPSLSDSFDSRSVATNNAVPTTEANVYVESLRFMTNGRDDAKNPSTHSPFELTPDYVPLRGSVPIGSQRHSSAIRGPANISCSERVFLQPSAHTIPSTHTLNASHHQRHPYFATSASSARSRR